MRHICFPVHYHLLGCLCRQVYYLYTDSFPFDLNDFVAQIGQGDDAVLIRHHYGDVTIAFSGHLFPRIMYSRFNHPWYENTALNDAYHRL